MANPAQLEAIINKAARAVLPPDMLPSFLALDLEARTVGLWAFAVATNDKQAANTIAAIAEKLGYTRVKV